MKTDDRLTDLRFTPPEVLKVLLSLNTGKATGADNIGNFLLKQTAHVIAEPLCQLFNYSLRTGKFPSAWKKSNVVPVHKKNDRQNKDNYRPISLLCNISKVFERLVHLKLYDFLNSRGLHTSKNSGFRKGDGTTNQLVSIVNKIQKGLDDGHDVRMVFLDLSKAFDKVWHKGLLFKLECVGMGGSLLSWFESYLTDRSQRVVINGQSSEFLPVETGVPQGSTLGPLLFLIYMNDIVDNISCDINLFADDTSLLEVMSDPVRNTENLNRDLQTLSAWAAQWLMYFNVLKTVLMTFSLKRQTHCPPVMFDGTPLPETKTHTHLGLTLTTNLSWDAHIDRLITKAGKYNNILKRLKYLLPRATIDTLYKTKIRPILEYANEIYDNCSIKYSNKLERFQVVTARICTGCPLFTDSRKLLLEVGWENTIKL